MEYKLFSIPIECGQCKGTCFVRGNQKQTQKNAMERFGKIPNPCVNGSGNKVQCPAVLRRL